jgi:hypothetical protein
MQSHWSLVIDMIGPRKITILSGLGCMKLSDNNQPLTNKPTTKKYMYEFKFEKKRFKEDDSR